MVQTTGQIETHIKNARDDLQSNLHELEYKVKSVTDWRLRFQKSPGTMMAVALGGGLLLSLVAGGGKRRSSSDAAAPRRDPAVGAGGQNQQIRKNLNEIKAALIGVGATEVKGFLSKLIPGFQDQLPPQGERPRFTADGVSSETRN